jgi:CRP-like cAMP-binding protein
MQPALQKFPKGQVIFKEGTQGRIAYIIKEGKVEIVTDTGDKRLVLGTVGSGGCFGEMAPILGGTRTATAIAAEYTEVYAIDFNTMNNLIKKVNPLLKAIVYSLITRVKKLNKSVADGGQVGNPLLGAATFFAVCAGSADKKNANKSDERSVPVGYAVKHMETLLGLSSYRVRAVLKQMQTLKLLSSSNNGSTLHYNPKEIVEQTKKVTEMLGDKIDSSLQVEYELIDLRKMSEVLGVAAEKIYNKFKTGELPDNIIMFRKSAMLALIKEKGISFITKPRLKKISELEDLDDLVFVDKDTLKTVLDTMDDIDIARIAKAAKNSVKKRISACVPPRKWGFIEEAVDELDEIDEIDLLHLEEKIIGDIQKLKPDDG